MKKRAAEGWGLFLRSRGKEILVLSSKEKSWTEEYLGRQRKEAQGNCIIRKIRASDWPRSEL